MSRTGELETQMAFDDVLAHIEDVDSEWVKRARYAVAAFCSTGQEFTAEAVRLVAGDPPTPNGIGALFHTIAAEGWIKFVRYTKSTRPEAHGRPIAVWRSAS